MRKHHLPILGILCLFSSSIFFNSCQQTPPQTTTCGLEASFFEQQQKIDCNQFNLPDNLKYIEKLLTNLETKEVNIDTLGAIIKKGITIVEKLDAKKHYLALSQLKKHYSEYLHLQSDVKEAINQLEESIDLLMPRLNTRCDSSQLASIYSYIGLNYHNIHL